MKRVLLIFLITFVIFSGTAFLLLFEGNIKNASSWWSSFTKDKHWMPFSPYSTRVENADKLKVKKSTQIEIIDRHIFWKGSGAIILPKINKDGTLVALNVKEGGRGYSKKVKANITGSGSEKFEIKNITVENGHIKNIYLKSSAKWYFLPTAFLNNESSPYTGIIEKKFPDGQNLRVDQYSNGLLHGISTKFTRAGLPVYKKEYKNGLKHGTHIYYFDIPLNPDNNLKAKKTLWDEINDQAKEKFSAFGDTNEKNEWIIENFRLKGGTFQVKLLEHWKENQRDGLFEAFDRFGNKRYKDVYKTGLRIDHKIFDKEKTTTFDRKVE
jgi:antitoxin component YwqK of YwqJK toxin-antitoxin module